MSTGYEGGFTRRQELTCTETEMAAYADVVLYENEHIYIKMNSGMIRLKIGDGKTGLLNLPWAKVFDATLDDVEAIVGGFASRVETNTKRIENLEAAVSPEIVTPVTDSTVAYSKTVPNGALPNAAVTEIGGMSYVKNGAILDSKVTAVESVGANLLNPNGFAKSSVTVVENSDGSYTITNITEIATSASQNVAKKLPAGTYTIKNDSTKHLYIMTSSSDYSNSVVNGSQKTFTYDGTSYLNLLFADFSANETAVVKIMLNRGATALPYSPYFRESLPIPGDALDGFGQGVSKDCYNKIVLDPLEGVKKYAKYIGKFDIGALNWDYSSADKRFFIQTSLIAKVSNSGAMKALCAGYTPISFNDFYADPTIDKTISRTGDYLFVRNLSYTGVTAFKNAMSGVVLLYELATPTETDVSAYFTEDNLLRVVPGGTITAANEFEHEVPFTVEYMIKGA